MLAVKRKESVVRTTSMLQQAMSPKHTYMRVGSVADALVGRGSRPVAGTRDRQGGAEAAAIGRPLLGSIGCGSRRAVVGLHEGQLLVLPVVTRPRREEGWGARTGQRHCGCGSCIVDQLRTAAHSTLPPLLQVCQVLSVTLLG